MTPPPLPLSFRMVAEYGRPKRPSAIARLLAFIGVRP